MNVGLPFLALLRASLCGSVRNNLSTLILDELTAVWSSDFIGDGCRNFDNESSEGIGAYTNLYGCFRNYIVIKFGKR